jgi:acid stress chaperone HdeB
LPKLLQDMNQPGQQIKTTDFTMKKLLAAAFAATTLMILPARAEVIDVSTIKCSDLTSMSTEEASYLLIWLHGYYGGKAEDTTIDLKSFETVAGDMGAKCAENPELGIMTAVQQVTE